MKKLSLIFVLLVSCITSVEANQDIVIHVPENVKQIKSSKEWKRIYKQIKNNKGRRITLVFEDGNGGNINTFRKIYPLIINNPLVHCKVSGNLASSSVLLMLACPKATYDKHTLVMWHNISNVYAYKRPRREHKMSRKSLNEDVISLNYTQGALDMFISMRTYLSIKEVQKWRDKGNYRPLIKIMNPRKDKK